MFIDVQCELSIAQALTATAVSTNVYDLGAVPSGGTSSGNAIDPSVGEPLAVVMTVGVAADFTTGDETYELDIITATASDGTTGQLIVSKSVILATELVAGRIIIFPIMPGRITQRYLGAKYVLAGTTPSVTVTTFVQPLSMVQKQLYYTSAIVVN